MSAQPEAPLDPSVFERFFQMSLDLMCIGGTDGYFRRVNPAFGILGYSEEELVSRPFMDFVHVDDQAATLEEMARLASGARTLAFENRYRCKDGTYRWLAWSTMPDASGTLYAVARDVTEAKAADASRARLAAIVESSNDAIVSTTLDGAITSWNSAAERAYGYSASEAIGRPMAMLVPAHRAGEDEEILTKIRRNERISNFETVRLRRDGSEFAAAVTISPIRDPAGRVVGASRICRDITELRRLQETLVRAKEDAEAANRELESFSYSVAHDLRAPLRGIDGFSQALLEDYGSVLDDEGQKYLRLVRESAQRMALLIDDLLALSRVTRVELTNDRVDLSALASRILAGLARHHPERTVELAIEDGLVAVGDPRLLELALENLLGNAWKFTSRAADARITFGRRTGDDGVTVYFVRDNGAGFDMKYAGKLFGVFQRLHSAAEFDGNGVGLATVRRIVNRHGGRIWGDGRVGEGATFSFTLEREAL